ncbi:MAG: S8 family serine peptidase [Planctomycetaceae bacterium]
MFSCNSQRGSAHDGASGTIPSWSVICCTWKHARSSRRPQTCSSAGGIRASPLESIKTDFDHQQLAAELYAELTTTGTADLLYGMHYELLDDVSTQVTYSSPLINLDAFQTHTSFAGMHGSGYSVVVLDTGIQLNHPHFGPDADGNGVADRIVYQYDFFHGDNNASDFDGHGTHVTGTIASSNTTYAGLAPEVDIILLKVFSDNLDSQPYTSSAVLEQALQWVVANAVEYNIAAVNMSLGGGNHQTAQIAHALRDEFAALAQLNVITVAASGIRLNSTAIRAWPGLRPIPM